MEPEGCVVTASQSGTLAVFTAVHSTPLILAQAVDLFCVILTLPPEMVFFPQRQVRTAPTGQQENMNKTGESGVLFRRGPICL